MTQGRSDAKFSKHIGFQRSLINVIDINFMCFFGYLMMIMIMMIIVMIIAKMLVIMIIIIMIIIMLVTMIMIMVK